MSGYLSSTNFAESGDLIGGSNQSFIKNLISFRPLSLKNSRILVKI